MGQPQLSPNLTFRCPTPSDLPILSEIYNHAVLNTTATFDTEPCTTKKFEPFLEYTAPCDVATPGSIATAGSTSIGGSSHLTTPSPPSSSSLPSVTSTPHLNRLIVATISETGAVVGYIGTYPFSARRAYAQLAEMMLYVHPLYQRQGIGKALMRYLHRDPQGSKLLEGLYTTLALINSKNSGALSLFRDEGYVERGHMVDVAEKFGRRHTLVILQRDVPSSGVNVSTEERPNGGF